VYFVYGMHHCVNVVCQPPEVPEAVLLRALEPVDGEALMRRRRRLPDAPAWRLCRGPGALCQAMGIGRAENGADLVCGPLRVLDAPAAPPRRVARSARIGVGYAGADAARPWRFLVRGSPAVSGRRVRGGRASSKRWDRPRGAPARRSLAASVRRVSRGLVPVLQRMPVRPSVYAGGTR